MKRTVRVVLTMLAASLPSRLAAQRIPDAAATATIPAAQRDVESADALITALYDANTNLVDHKKDADRFRSLFIPGGRLMPTAGGPVGKSVIGIQTVEDYVQRAMSSPLRHGFSEREIARTSQAFGNIMHVFSTYETFRDSTDKNPVHGINSIQLFSDGTRWWVVSVLWDNERANKPIPSAFLKRVP